MSRYFQAMERRKTGLVPYTDSRPVDSRTRPLSEVVARTQPMTLAPVASAQGLLDSIAACQSLRRLSEQLSASSAYNGPARILMTGCRPGDGVSTVAAATVASGSIAVQGTQWPRLETARPEQMDLAEHPARLVEDLDELLMRYRLAVIDLGVVRLDPRMLALARPNDPILIVARHLHTDRAEMIATVNVLRNTGHPVAGVILNGYKSPLPALVRRLVGMEA